MTTGSEGIGETEASPYRKQSIPDEPLTDAEMALWDAVFAASAGRRVADDEQVGWAASAADKAVALRRKKFGLR